MFVVPEIFSIFVPKSKTFVMNKRFFFIFLMSFIGTQSIISQCNHPDYEGLMEFYNSLGGSNWNYNKGWKEGAEGTNCDPCNGWDGILCENNRVTEMLLFSDNNLKGHIPDLRLSELKRIRIQNQNIISPIPNFQFIPKLKSLELDSVGLCGIIPDFSNLPKLEILSLKVNNLEGQIPNFSNLPNLTKLILYKNNLNSTIPEFNLSKLTELWLDSNILYGKLPTFVNCPNLEIIALNSNSLSGLVPNFPNLNKLRYLNLYSNNLAGEIPNFTNLSNLEYLYLGNNKFSESIPDFSNSPLLKIIWLGRNALTGTIPNFDYLANLENLNISNNNLSGCYNESLCKINDFSSVNNPKLPWFGDIDKYCNGESQINVSCDDGLINTNNDMISTDCFCVGQLDSIFTIYDTIVVQIYDTTIITITETISVTDTLIINLNIPNSSNDPITNRIIVYPNPTSSHITIDFGNHSLMQNYTCQILNTLGQPVYFTPIDQKLYYLDLNTWGPKGTYFLKIINDFGQTVETKKIILQ